MPKEKQPPYKLLAFDLETSMVFPDGFEASRWRELRPLGISCLALYPTPPDTPRVFHGSEQIDGTIARRMSPGHVRNVVKYLWDYTRRGYSIVTWNGLNFDFDILAEEAEDATARKACEVMAMAHIDIAFAMLCSKGYMIGLDAAAKGLGVEGKPVGMKGSMAPLLWRQSRKNQERILAYVAQDARATFQVYHRIIERKRLPWISKRGLPHYWEPELIDGRLLTVSEANGLDKPETAWMTNPLTREACYAWINRDNIPQLAPLVAPAPIEYPSKVTLHLDDAHARLALRTYAALIRPEHPTEAEQLVEAIMHYGGYSNVRKELSSSSS